MQKKNACWVFEIVRIILIIISLICFTEKVYGSSPYSPKVNPNKELENFHLFLFFVGCNWPIAVVWVIKRKALL